MTRCALPCTLSCSSPRSEMGVIGHRGLGCLVLPCFGDQFDLATAVHMSSPPCSDSLRTTIAASMQIKFLPSSPPPFPPANNLTHAHTGMVLSFSFLLSTSCSVAESSNGKRTCTTTSFIVSAKL
eukprot:TRINITY_DN8065_c0_g1_i4.p1 TRINITY_DN8065_c0_g1~~TRINITY_DN8065_c0_g1_i4.p1  ORF type:complete len:125 (-),score=5.62 TRINITY_DN8065_c0_g1_i4:10-384(-)